MNIPELLRVLYKDLDKSYGVVETRRWDWETDYPKISYTGFELRRSDEKVIAVLDLIDWTKEWGPESDKIPDSLSDIISFQPRHEMTLLEFYELKNQCLIPISDMNRWWTY